MEKMSFIQMLREAKGGSEVDIVIEHEDRLDIKKMTVEQVLDSEAFERELIKQIENETKHHSEMAKQAFYSGMRLQRAPIQSLIDKGVFDAENVRDIYKHIICKTLQGFSAAEREYIKNVCMMAYWRVVEQNKQHT